jgi:hypothetical protein
MDEFGQGPKRSYSHSSSPIVKPSMHSFVDLSATLTAVNFMKKSTQVPSVLCMCGHTVRTSCMPIGGGGGRGPPAGSGGEMQQHGTDMYGPWSKISVSPKEEFFLLSGRGAGF